MDFNDCRLSLDTAFMEQNFANFAALFDYADSAAMAHGASVLLDKAATSGEAFDFLNAIIDKYLYDPESPMYNEEYYTHFLRALLAGNRLDDAGRERARYRLETAMKTAVAPMPPISVTSCAAGAKACCRSFAATMK